jgi:hypothetical protein
LGHGLANTTIMNSEGTKTYDKARRINLDAAVHGTFAEIGAGQEVARWFFRVGGASATVATTISAYDMAVSDAIYGPSDHYVSRQRLQAMLRREYDLLLQRLHQKRAATTLFFVFADTVAMRSRTHPEAGHGWMGTRFQHQPQAEPSEIIIHVKMLDREHVREQEALGILGVNLIHGASYHNHEPTALICSLMDDLTPERVEIDMIRFSGPCFASVDDRLMSLQLVEQGFTDAAMFMSGGEVVQPAEVLYEKPVLVERGSFRPVTNTTVDMLRRATEQFRAELAGSGEEPVVVMEMSLRNLQSGGQVIDHADFLARADILGVLGKTVMISSFAHYYPLVAYLRDLTSKPIALALGIPNFKQLMDEKYYSDLDGGLLASLGRLFRGRVKLYVYPNKVAQTGPMVTLADLEVEPHLRHLYQHLIENRLAESIENADERQMHILPRDVLSRIQRGDSSWENMVPREVVQVIKQHKLLGYRPSGTGDVVSKHPGVTRVGDPT